MSFLRIVKARSRSSLGQFKTKVGQFFIFFGLRLGRNLRISDGLRLERFPAGLARWLTRKDDRQGSTVTNLWPHEEQPLRTNSRLGVVIHVSYAAIFRDVCSYLANIPVNFDLIVTDSTGELTELNLPDLPNLQFAKILQIEEQGRDMLAIAALVSANLLEPYDLLVKLHICPIEDSGRGLDVSCDLISDGLDLFMGTTERVQKFLSTFAADPSLGILTPPGTLHGSETWGKADIQRVSSLLSRLQMPSEKISMKFATGSVQIIRAFVLQGLRSFNVTEWDFESDAARQVVPMATSMERLIGAVTHEAGCDLREYFPSESTKKCNLWKRYSSRNHSEPHVRIIPFYSSPIDPKIKTGTFQGFSWLNVVQAKSVYLGHWQPFLPADLGIYNIGDPGLLSSQVDLANSAGINDFAYKVHCFGGKLHGDQAIENHVSSFVRQGFCIVWAHESNAHSQFSMPERERCDPEKMAECSLSFIDRISSFLTDPRYISLKGKPVVIVEGVNRFADFSSIVSCWQAKVAQLGLPGLAVVAVNDGTPSGLQDTQLDSAFVDAVISYPSPLKTRGIHSRDGVTFDGRFVGQARRYDKFARDAEMRIWAHGETACNYPVVSVDYDTSAAERWNPEILLGANPYTFRKWFASAVASVSIFDSENQIVFIKSWNDWHERAVLEPSQQHGKAYLLAVRDVLFS